MSVHVRYSDEELDAIAEKHGLATITQLKNLKKDVDIAIKMIKTKSTYTPKDFQLTMIRWRLSRKASEILKKIGDNKE
jgi:hypothetical protein